MKTTSKIIAGVAATLSLAVAGAVFAHPGFGMGQGMGQGMGPGMGFGGMGPGPGFMGGMGPGFRGGMGPGMGGWGPGMGPGATGQDMAAFAAARTAELKTQLKITPAQETAWKAYETAVTKQATEMQTLRAQMQAQMQNAQPGAANPDFAVQRQAMIAQHDASRAAHSAALKDLYAVLTPEQRAVADRGMSFMGAQRGPGRHFGR